MCCFLDATTNDNVNNAFSMEGSARTKYYADDSAISQPDQTRHTLKLYLPGDESLLLSRPGGTNQVSNSGIGPLASSSNRQPSAGADSRHS